MASAKARMEGQEPPERRPPCFFDPRHGPSSRDVEWSPPYGEPRLVPACEADAQRVERGDDPQAREVEWGGRRVPYWQAGPAYGPFAGGYFGGFGGVLPGLLIGSVLGGAMSPSAGWADGRRRRRLGGGDFGGGDFGGGGGGLGGGRLRRRRVSAAGTSAAAATSEPARAGPGGAATLAPGAARAVASPPAHAALALRGDDRPFALIGAWAGGGARARLGALRVAGAGDDLFALPRRPARRSRRRGGGASGGGWVGFLGFELRQRSSPAHPPPPRPVPLPDGALAFYDHVLRLDPDGRWWFEALWTPERAAALERRARRELAARLAAPPRPRPFATRDWRWMPSPAGHARGGRGVPRAHRRRRPVPGQPLPAPRGRGSTATPLDLFAAAVDRAADRPRRVRRRPVGRRWPACRPSCSSPAAAAASAARRSRARARADRRAELEASAKDRAENVMIVDLVRNDLGRVCRPGSVRVAALAEVRPHAGVWHLVSEVEGELRDGVGDARPPARHLPARLGDRRAEARRARRDRRARVDRAARPTPARSASPSPLAGLELSVAIRTFELRGARIWLGVGGGVVADSDAAAEAREAAAKAAPLLAAIGAAPGRRSAAARGQAPRWGPVRALRSRRGPAPGAAPRPRGRACTRPCSCRTARRATSTSTSPASPASLRALYGARRRPTTLAERAVAAARAATSAPGCAIDVTPGERDVRRRRRRCRAAAAGALRPVVAPRRARTAQVARPPAARGPRGRRPGDHAAAARRRRLGARGEPGELVARRARRHAAHAAAPTAASCRA